MALVKGTKLQPIGDSTKYLEEYLRQIRGSSESQVSEDWREVTHETGGDLRRSVEIAERRADENLVRAQILLTQNEELRGELRDLRKSVAQITRVADQQQSSIERHQEQQDQLIKHLVERGRANDQLLNFVYSSKSGHILMAETYEGFVTDVNFNDVIVVYETETDAIRHQYHKAQFTDGKLPAVGQRIITHICVSAGDSDAEKDALRDDVEGKDDHGERIDGRYEF
jgi:hypothetical protein